MASTALSSNHMVIAGTASEGWTISCGEPRSTRHQSLPAAAGQSDQRKLLWRRTLIIVAARPLIKRRPACTGRAMMPQNLAALAARYLNAERRADLGLLGGGAMAASDQRIGDAVFLERLADRERAFGARHRAAGRDQIGHEHDVVLDHTAKEIAFGMWVLDVVDADLAARIILE